MLSRGWRILQSGIRNFTIRTSPYSLKNFLIFVGVITTYRFLVLYFGNQFVNTDEAQYWLWSQNLDWGYFSKPPMVAWLIALANQFSDNATLSMKLVSLFFYPLITLIVYGITKEIFQDKTAFFAGMVFLTMPAVSLSSIIISTDVPLFLFWSLTLYLFILSLKTNKTRYWMATGFFAGLGLLSKHNMILFLPSVFVYLLWSRENRKVLMNPKLYFSMLIAFLIFLPNLFWIVQNDFITFSHLKEISQVERDLFHLDKLGGFLLDQLAVFGLISFSLLLIFLYKVKLYKNNEYLKLLLVFSFLFLLVISFQALISRAFANWAAPAYVAGSVIVGYMLSKAKIWVFIVAITLNMTLSAVIYHYDFLAQKLDIELHKGNDPFKKDRGWPEFARELDLIKISYPDHYILGLDRTVLFKTAFYTNPHILNVQIFNPEKIKSNHFQFSQDLNLLRGKNFILISNSKDITKISKFFDISRFIKEIKIPIHSDYQISYHLFELQNFKGY